MGICNNNLLTGLNCLVQRPTPNLEDQASVFMTPGDRVAQLYPQALGTHFSRLLRHSWVTVGLFFNPGHHTGLVILTNVNYSQSVKLAKIYFQFRNESVRICIL
jgi:hypothetical protein